MDILQFRCPDERILWVITVDSGCPADDVKQLGQLLQNCHPSAEEIRVPDLRPLTSSEYDHIISENLRDLFFSGDTESPQRRNTLVLLKTTEVQTLIEIALEHASESTPQGDHDPTSVQDAMRKVIAGFPESPYKGRDSISASSHAYGIVLLMIQEPDSCYVDLERRFGGII